MKRDDAAAALQLQPISRDVLRYRMKQLNLKEDP